MSGDDDIEATQAIRLLLPSRLWLIGDLLVLCSTWGYLGLQFAEISHGTASNALHLLTRVTTFALYLLGPAWSSVRLGSALYRFYKHQTVRRDAALSLIKPQELFSRVAGYPLALSAFASASILIVVIPLLILAGAEDTERWSYYRMNILLSPCPTLWAYCVNLLLIPIFCRNACRWYNVAGAIIAGPVMGLIALSMWSRFASSLLGPSPARDAMLLVLPLVSGAASIYLWRRSARTCVMVGISAT